jgi:AcrR family transcriptional regulator
VWVAKAEAPSPTRTPRTGRRPGASSTRQAILGSARRLFAERGYEGATMRAIAADAGVDAALVVHFFGTKAALLIEAIDWPFNPQIEVANALIDGPRQAGRRLVTLFLRTWDEENRRNPILTLLRAATTEPQAARMLREFLRQELFAPLMERLGSDEPELRANLAAAQLVGLGIARYVLGFEPLASAEPADVVAWIAPTLQRYLTGKFSH